MLPRPMPNYYPKKPRKRLSQILNCSDLIEKMVASIDLEEGGNPKRVTNIAATTATTTAPSSFPATPRNPGIKDARKKGLPWLIAALVVSVFVLLLLLLLFIILNNNSHLHNHQNNHGESKKSSLDELTRSDWPSQSSKSLEATFQKTAVVSDNVLCSEIGRTVLIKGGNAIDAGIATTFCIGGLNGHSSGIGGGFLMTAYDGKSKKCSTIDAREAAPLATNENSFKENPKDIFVGYKSIATPGEVHGLWTAFKRYGSGRIAWQDLIFPIVNLLKSGYPVTKLMANNLKIIKDDIEKEPTLKDFLINKAIGKPYKEGEIIKNPELAETLRKIAVSTDPVKLFYHGEIAQEIAAEIFANEGYLTKRDFEQYQSIVDDKPIENDDWDDEYVMCGPKPPSGFAVTQFIVNVMSKLYPIGSDPETLIENDEYYHRFIEAQKYGYAQRTLLGKGVPKIRYSESGHKITYYADLRFDEGANKTIQQLTNKTYISEIAEKIKQNDKPLEPSEYGAQVDQPGKHGTSHISVIDAQGNAVSITSSVNNIYGARRRSERLGIIYNNQMDDFSIPGQKNFFGFEPTKANYILPGKRPMSSMAPIIIYNKNSGAVKASIGAAGGSKIISTLSQFILQTFNFNQTVKESIDFPRIHNQFTPFSTNYEKGFPEIMIESLQNRGHNMTFMEFPIATVQAIVRNPDGSLSASNDHRRPVYMNPAGY